MLNKKTEIQILQEYKSVPLSQFQNHYHIILNNDGTVYDCKNKITHDTLMSWAINTHDKQGFIE